MGKEDAFNLVSLLSKSLEPVVDMHNNYCVIYSCGSTVVWCNALKMTQTFFILKIGLKQKRSTEGCSKFKGPETRQVQERSVLTLEHMQVPKLDRTRCPEE